jgi:two-component system, NtrC family, sensor kinase
VLGIIRRSPADAQPVFDAIVQSAARLCGAIFGTVYLYENDRLRIAATNNLTPEATSQLHELQQLKRPERSHLAGRAILDRALIHVPDVLKDPEYSRELALAGGWRAVLGIPLLSAGKPVGALSVAKAEPTPFSDRQIQLLKTFADQAVIAIENVRLFEAEQARTRELSESLEQQTATSEVLKIISSSPGELEPVFNAMLANAIRICAATFGNLFLGEGPIFRSVTIHSKQQSHVDSWRRNPIIDLRNNPGLPLDRVANTKQLVHIPDLRADQSYLAKNDRMVTLVEVAGARTYLIVPMLKEGQLIGAINMYRQEVRPFTDKQIELVKNFAAQAVIAIENTRLLNELRESLQQQTATSEVLKVISSTPGELEPVFNAMLNNATRICEAKFGILQLCEGDGFRAVALHDVPPAYADWRLKSVLQPGPEHPLGRVVRTKQTIHVADILAEPEDARGGLATLAGARTILNVPMLKENQLIGVISIYRQEVLPFTDKQIELVKNFAAQAVIAIENARLLSELRESLQQQTATADVLKVISSSPGELEPVFEAMLANATQLCNAKFGTLNLYDGDAFRIMAVHNVPPAFAETRLHELIRPHPRGGHAQMVRTKEVVHIEDIRKGQAYLEGDPAVVAVSDLGGARTIVLVPMLKDDKLVGTINIYRQEVLPFTDKQIELVKNFAAQAIIAIENARLLSELRESLQQQTATADVLKVISRSTFDLQTVLDTLVESAAHLCGAEMANIWRPKDGTYRLTASYGVTARYKEYLENKEFLNTVAIEKGRGTMVGRVLLEGKTVHMHDIQADPDYKLSGLVALGGYRTMLGVPMLREGDPIGVLVLVQSAVRPFTDKQIELATTFADQAVIAIENVRLFEEVQARTRELSETLEQQTATADVLKVISSSLNDLRPVFETIGHRAEKLCDAEISVISMVDGDQIRLVSINGVSEEGVEAVRRVYPMRRDDETLTARAIRSCTVCHVPDVLSDPLYQSKDAARVSGFRAGLAVPMIREGQVIGAIFVSRKQAGLFPDAQVQLLKTFADQAVIAIENVRLFNETKDALAQQTATADVLKLISRSAFDTDGAPNPH